MPELSRRGFLKLAAGGGAAAAVGFAGKTIEKLIPYVTPITPSVPGVWSYYSTVCRECPAGCGMVVSHRDGRVTKCEGNPDHPVNRGALCARGQSAVQGLYDPDRIRTPLARTAPGQEAKPVSWDDAMAAIAGKIKSADRVVVISDLQTGALAEVMEQFQRAANGSERSSSSAPGSKQDKVLYYEPFNYEPLRRANEILFGKAVVPDHNLESCDFIISFAADFLETWISPVQYAGQFAQAHSYRFPDNSSYGKGSVARFVYVGPRVSMTAANADQYIPVSPGREAIIALAMVESVANKANTDKGREVQAALKTMGYQPQPLPEGITSKQIDELAEAFVSAKASVALAGPTGAMGSAATLTAMAAGLLNYAAGRIGQTVNLHRSHALSKTSTVKQVRETLNGLTSKDVLIVHNANPAYAMSGIADAIRRAGIVIYMGSLQDETAALAHWVLPIDSPLEAWGDYSPLSYGDRYPRFGVVHGLMQPTMARLYDSRLAGDVFLDLAKAMGRPLASGPGVMEDGSEAPAENFLDWLRNDCGQLAEPKEGEDFELFWTGSLRGGLWEKCEADTYTDPTASKAPVSLRKDLGDFKIADSVKAAFAPLPAGQVSLFVWPTIMLFDGRTANRGWLQEAPEPVSYACWSSWLDVHPDLAKKLGLEDKDVVRIRSGQEMVENVAVRLTELQSPECVCLALGQGHTAMGHNAAGTGVNAWRLLPATGEREMFVGVQIEKTGHAEGPVYGSGTQDQHYREILQWEGIDQLHKKQWGEGDKLILPLPEGYRPDADIYKPHGYDKYRWAMAIDLQKCIGCGACGVACYAENNLQVMGEKYSRRNLEMAWLKVVPYRNDEDPRRMGFLPMLCQHCDTGPCEPVCPVYASVHSEEGLNAQIYNRCVGTRYCSNNCPYKVRRFNWLNSPLRDRPECKPEWVKPLDWQLNPEVTVRERGVMEKCTFCIQRIRQAQHQAKREGRSVKDGEIQPACVQTCPTRAFVFGNLLDPNSQVSLLTRGDPRRYHVLEEQNTKPAITYLRRIVLE
jgi:molybdopterin-containing oxidoreductase family iron-sulfur binding subunit